MKESVKIELNEKNPNNPDPKHTFCQTFKKHCYSCKKRLAYFDEMTITAQDKFVCCFICRKNGKLKINE